MTERVNLVDAYDNRSVIAKMVSMEERISGAESSIEKTVEDGQTSIDTKVDTGVTKINSLLTGLDTTIAKAEAAAATAETASIKAETAAKSVDEDIVAANNAVIDAQGYATTGKLHDGTVVTSADNIAKSCQTYADTASKSATAASTSATAAAASQASAAQNAASAEASAKDASTYLDTVKASADAATTSATAAAQSAIDAQAIADSMDVSNFVTLSDAQSVPGAKYFQNAGNTAKVAARTTSAATTDVINSGDISTLNGKYNNLVHRTGDISTLEVITGHKVLPMCDVMGSGPTGSWASYNYPHMLLSTQPSESTFKARYASNTFNEAARMRLLVKVKTQIGDVEAELYLKETLDETTSSGTKYYHWVMYKCNVLSNTMVASTSATLHLSVYSNRDYRSSYAYVYLWYTGASLYWMQYAIEARAAMVTPGVESYALYKCTVETDESTLPSSYLESPVTLDIPITAYTEE